MYQVSEELKTVTYATPSYVGTQKQEKKKYSMYIHNTVQMITHKEGEQLGYDGGHQGVCVCVCMCMHVCMCVHVYVCMHAGIALYCDKLTVPKDL